MLRIILASASPRRIELLKQVGLRFDIQPSDIDEDSKGFDDAGKYAMEMSRRKALSVAQRIEHAAHPDTFVLGADTVVCIDGQILGKPSGEEDARRMLTLLENRWHEVTTGITLVRTGSLDITTDMEVTRVKFSPYPRGFIDRYIATGEPYGKAGSYAIQGYGSLVVERIEGCYFNIVGLPLFKLSRLLERRGHKALTWLSER